MNKANTTINLHHCGECPLFPIQDVNGNGWCEVEDKQCNCKDLCTAEVDTSEKVITVLHYAQKWLRGEDIPMLPPALFGLAIDGAVKLLRKQNKER